VKNVLIRRNYRPSRMGSDPVEEFAAEAKAGRLTAEELLTRYVTIVYSGRAATKKRPGVWSWTGEQ